MDQHVFNNMFYLQVTDGRFELEAGIPDAMGARRRHSHVSQPAVDFSTLNQQPPLETLIAGV